MQFKGILIALLLLIFIVGGTAAESGYFTTIQTPQLVLSEAETVYRTNLTRQAAGLPPLRWNAELSQAARWFAWDSVENRSDIYCGHEDTLGNWPNVRAEAFGYPGSAGSENVYCGYVTPQRAVEGWMDSGSGHANNILDPSSREIGLGYYHRDLDGDGYVVQDFGHDPAFAPVVIENEALNTTSSQVGLYIYNRADAGGFAGLRPATAMQVSDDACYSDAAWQAYQPSLSWSLPGGEGWKAVYARLRDAYGYTTSASDSIYVGAAPPLEQITTAQMSSASPTVTLYELDSGGRSSIQYSLGWLADRFKRPSDNSLLAQVDDPQALDGRALLLPTSGSSFAWDWTTTFHPDTSMVAYFRLKVSSNSSTSEVAQLHVIAGHNDYPPVSLKGSHFKAAGQYQEFAVPFTFSPDQANPFLIFEVQRTASIDLSVDVITIFTAPQPYTGETMTVTPPGGSYRGQGVWLRYSEANLNNFTPFSSAVTVRPELRVDKPGLTFLAGLAADDPLPQAQRAAVQVTCGGSFTWQVSDNAAWLHTARNGELVEVSVDLKGLPPGDYRAELSFTTSDPTVPAVRVPVSMILDEDLASVFLPGVRR